MIRNWHRAKRFALILLASASLMSVAATSAQAGPEWQIGGSPMGGLQTILSSNFLATITVPFYGTVHITLGHVQRTIHPSNPGSGNGRMPMAGVILNSKKEKIETCKLEPFEVVFEDALITHNGQIYDVYKAAEKATNLMEIKATGELCPLPEVITIQGTYAYAVPATEAVKLAFKTVSEATETLIGVGLTSGGKKVIYTAEPIEELVEKNVGKKWGAK